MEMEPTGTQCQLLEAVQSVHKAVQSNNRGEEDQRPPVPPYPDVSSLRLDEERDMTELSQKNQFSSQHQHSYGLEQSKPHVFSDDELSEIFQIDFGQIFGNPDSDRQNNYKGIQLK